MSNPSKARGTKAESDVVAYLRRNGFPTAERRALAGGQDKGDVWIPGLPLMIEVKDCKRVQRPKWLGEVKAQTEHSGASVGVLWCWISGRVLIPHRSPRLHRPRCLPARRHLSETTL